jgi:8-oxo-dGTP diphosphatase/2-hydroxy-dATP diphosphatase
MRIETLLIIQQGQEIILGLKNPNKKFGGLWNGWGGGIEEGETPEQAILREFTEESMGIKIANPKKVGEILFQFETDEQDHYVHIFCAQKYKGTFKPSEDFTEYQKFSIENLPSNMMPADKYWILLLIKGKNFKGKVFLHKDKEPKINFYEVEEFN